MPNQHPVSPGSELTFPAELGDFLHSSLPAADFGQRERSLDADLSRIASFGRYASYDDEETRAESSRNLWYRFRESSSSGLFSWPSSSASSSSEGFMRPFRRLVHGGFSADTLRRLDLNNAATLLQLDDSADLLTPGDRLVLFITRSRQLRAAVGFTHRWLRAFSWGALSTVGEHIGLEQPSEDGSQATLATEDAPDGDDVRDTVYAIRPRNLRDRFWIIPDARISTPSRTPSPRSAPIEADSFDGSDYVGFDGRT
eukprot:gnl/TRDRNA2_/TRDRNA2_174745_c1_seq1.p1 gnl/TRDRNA2_/TRDRNA2_174745_c1~~gnl/TRDRNA2_/TRDRNA2_174745_c1_seq1.p1  ORF type:complete len:294 (-),score=21.05 gnl/TRDRNA2_/TRDRNA2_174745_c1_seq1:258-1025(-)